MTRYNTYIDSETIVGQETILSVQENGSEYGIGISSTMQVENLNVLNYVGIGTTNPLQQLQVGTANSLGISTDGKVFVVTSNGDVGIGTTNPTSKLHVVGDTLIEQNLYVSGSIGIGTTNPGGCGKLEVIGTICATDFNSTSDKILKTNIQKISDPLDKVLQLNGYTFNWKETNKQSVGVIAQELEQIFPQLVSGFSQKSVNYNGIIAVLIESIKELNQKVEDLTEEVKSLRMTQ